MTPDPSSRREAVSTADAPAAIGPYSQAIAHGDLLFCSGALPIDPASGDLVEGSVGAETTRCLQNLEAVCGAAGGKLASALRLTVYTTRLDSFAEINAAYGEFFKSEPPARVTIGVAALPKDARVEIDAIVALA
jgi:2-iminobutanoate/2-iminopropanoate deaminase